LIYKRHQFLWIVRVQEDTFIFNEFGREGVTFYPATKADRVSGWEVLRRLMQDAGTDKDGFYASRACEYFWQTVPYLGRDPRKPNDCDSRGPDHAAVRYAVLRRSHSTTQREF